MIGLEKSYLAIYTFFFVSCSLTIIVTCACSHSHSLGNLSQSIHSYIKAICVTIHSRIAYDRDPEEWLEIVDGRIIGSIGAAKTAGDGRGLPGPHE